LPARTTGEGAEEVLLLGVTPELHGAILPGLDLDSLGEHAFSSCTRLLLRGLVPIFNSWWVACQQVRVKRQPGRGADWFVTGICQLKVIRNVWDGIAKSIVPLREEIKDCLTRQGMQNTRALHRKRLAKTFCPLEGEKG